MWAPYRSYFKFHMVKARNNYILWMGNSKLKNNIKMNERIIISNKDTMRYMDLFLQHRVIESSNHKELMLLINHLI